MDSKSYNNYFKYYWIWERPSLLPCSSLPQLSTDQAIKPNTPPLWAKSKTWTSDQLTQCTTYKELEDSTMELKMVSTRARNLLTSVSMTRLKRTWSTLSRLLLRWTSMTWRIWSQTSWKSLKMSRHACPAKTLFTLSVWRTCPDALQCKSNRTFKRTFSLLWANSLTCNPSSRSSQLTTQTISTIKPTKLVKISVPWSRLHSTIRITKRPQPTRKNSENI